LIAFLVVMVVYQIENYVLQPTIIGKAARISGFTVLASVLAFGALFGLVGAIIGVPIAAGIQIVVEELTSARRARIAPETAFRATLHCRDVLRPPYVRKGLDAPMGDNRTCQLAGASKPLTESNRRPLLTILDQSREARHGPPRPRERRKPSGSDA
jgi:hypothetical protein